jgi:hypothetical protein
MKCKQRSLILCAAFLTIAADLSCADELDGVYCGGNFGRARNAYGTGFIDSQLSSEATAAGDTLALTRQSTDRLSDFWSGDAGYLFTPYVGLEASFLHVGEIRYIAIGSVTNSGTSESLASTTEVTSHGPAISLVLRLPLAEAFDASLRLGDYYGKTTFDNDLIVGSKRQFTEHSKSGSSLLARVGAAYTIAAHYAVHVDYLRIEQAGDISTGKFSVNVLSAGVSYAF